MSIFEAPEAACAGDVAFRVVQEIGFFWVQNSIDRHLTVPMILYVTQKWVMVLLITNEAENRQKYLKLEKIIVNQETYRIKRLVPE